MLRPTSCCSTSLYVERHIPSSHAPQRQLSRTHDTFAFLVVTSSSPLQCFGVIDLWTNNHAVSALVTYFLERALVALRRHYGSKRLARTTLVDPRFLL